MNHNDRTDISNSFTELIHLKKTHHIPIFNMAAIAVDTYQPAPYNHLALQALSDVDVAAQQLEEVAGYNHIRNCIRSVFSPSPPSLLLQTYI